MPLRGQPGDLGPHTHTPSRSVTLDEGSEDTLRAARLDLPLLSHLWMTILPTCHPGVQHGHPRASEWPRAHGVEKGALIPLPGPGHLGPEISGLTAHEGEGADHPSLCWDWLAQGEPHDTCQPERSLSNQEHGAHVRAPIHMCVHRCHMHTGWRRGPPSPPPLRAPLCAREKRKIKPRGQGPPRGSWWEPHEGRRGQHTSVPGGSKAQRQFRAGTPSISASPGPWGLSGPGRGSSGRGRGSSGPSGCPSMLPTALPWSPLLCCFCRRVSLYLRVMSLGVAGAVSPPAGPRWSHEPQLQD